jgi:hypothetical protein
MTSQTTKRRRGVILTATGLQKLQDAKVTVDQFGYRQTFEVLSDRTLLDPRTIAKIVERKERVDKRTLEQFFERLELQLNSDDYTTSTPAATTRIDLQEAIDVPVFYNRSKELNNLVHWVVQERCRLVAILGMGGIGKTALSVKLTQQIASQFEFVIWKSLRNAPPLKDILTNLVQFLSHQQETMLPDNLGTAISRLLVYLTQHRCLLVLDNAESILKDGVRAGCYREGYEEYGELLRQLAETRHQSCVILTSREKPKELKRLEGATLPVRSLQLSGLSESAARELFQAKGTFWGSEADWSALIQYYGGNPLALQIVAPAVKEYLNGDIAELIGYIKHGKFIFDDIRDLLERQFERLSALEQQVMYW